MGKNKVITNLHKSIFYLQQSIIEDAHKELYKALDIMVDQLEANRQKAIKESNPPERKQDVGFFNKKDN